MHRAAIRGDARRIKELIIEGADVNVKDFAGNPSVGSGETERACLGQCVKGLLLATRFPHWDWDWMPHRTGQGTMVFLILVSHQTVECPQGSFSPVRRVLLELGDVDSAVGHLSIVFVSAKRPGTAVDRFSLEHRLCVLSTGSQLKCVPNPTDFLWGTPSTAPSQGLPHGQLAFQPAGVRSQSFA